MAKKSMSYDDVLAKCAALCAKAEHSRVEMIGRMCRWGVSRELAQMVADRLEDGGFIDARRFAEAFVHDKSKFDFWGRIKIRYYLRMNGIKDDLIEEAVSRIDPEEYQEGELALPVLRKEDEGREYHERDREKIELYHLHLPTSVTSSSAL